MKFSHLFFFNPSFIKNVDKPLCKDCKYFKYDSIYNDFSYGKCTKFGKKNLIDGKITFEDVVLARHHDCTVNATYFEEKINDKN
jgi:hypothetical protein